MWPKVINKVKVTHQGQGHVKVKVKYIEWSQNTILLASTQAVYKAPHSTVRDTDTNTFYAVAVAVGSLRV